MRGRDRMRGTTHNRSARFFLAGGVAIAALAFASPTLAQTKSFDLPEQPAGRGISAFAKQAGVPIISSQMLVRSKRTNRVVGNYGVDEGLRILVNGTGLIAVPVGTTGLLTIPSAKCGTADTNVIS